MARGLDNNLFLIGSNKISLAIAIIYDSGSHHFNLRITIEVEQCSLTQPPSLALKVAFPRTRFSILYSN